MNKSYEETLDLMNDFANGSVLLNTMNDSDLSNIIIALEKQISKKPIEQIRLLGLDKGGKCPSCQKYINNNRYWMYCECGQKLDWN